MKQNVLPAVLVQQAENEVKMDAVKRKNQIITNITAVGVFIVCLAVNFIFFWFDVIKDGFLSGEGILNQVPVVSIRSIVISTVFIAVMCVYNIFGWMLRNRLMVLLTAGYECLLLLGIVLLAFLAGGAIENATFYNAVLWMVFAVISPVYGFLWMAGSWAFAVFIPLFIFSIIIFIKLCQANKKFKN
jgi:hypothetical protein